MFKIDPAFRLAAVERYDVNTVLFSSILQFGDVFSINAESNALALQEEGNMFADVEKDIFEIYPLFKEVPTHLPYVPNVKLNRINLNPTIQIGSINYNSISSSSASVVGSVHNAYMISRVHQIRHFLKMPTLHYQTPSQTHTQPTFSELMQPLMTSSTQQIQPGVLLQPTTTAQPVIPVQPVVPVQPVIPIPPVIPPSVPVRKTEQTESTSNDN